MLHGFMQLFPTQLLMVKDTLFILFSNEILVLCRIHIGFFRKNYLKRKKSFCQEKIANRKCSTSVAWVLSNVPSLNWSRSDYHKSFFSYVNTNLASDCLSLNLHNFPGSLCYNFYVITLKVHKMKMPLLWLSTSWDLFGAMSLV